MTNDPVVSAAIIANGVILDFYYVAYRYPTSLPAGKAWERANKSSVGEELSVFRMREAVGDEWFVAAISEQREPVSKAVRILRPQGTLLALPDDVLGKLVMRRARTVTESGGEQRARYGRPGVEIDDAGRVHPYRGDDADE